MAYASIQLFRQLTNQSKEVISDEILKAILPIADRLVNKQIATQIHLELLDGKIDGSNKDFRVAHAPIADTDTKNITLVDSCNVVTGWTKGGDGADIATSRRLTFGSVALTLEKDGSSNVESSWTKTLGTQVDGTGRRLKITVFIKDTQVLTINDALHIRIGNDNSNYFSITLGRDELKNGINEIDVEIGSTDMGVTGTVTISELDYLLIEYRIPSSGDTVTANEIIMDFWRLEDIDDPDTNDIEVFYATNDDTTGFREFGSKQTVSSLQPRDGIIVMNTAPTTTTAEAGVFASYSYVPLNLDWNLINPAACYMAAHIASFIIAGQAPNYTAIQDTFARRDVAGAPDEWLRLALSLLINAMGQDSSGIGFRRIETKDLT